MIQRKNKLNWEFINANLHHHPVRVTLEGLDIGGDIILWPDLDDARVIIGAGIPKAAPVQSSGDLQDTVKALNDSAHNMNDWETDFITDMLLFTHFTDNQEKQILKMVKRYL